MQKNGTIVFVLEEIVYLCNGFSRKYHFFTINSNCKIVFEMNFI